MFLAAIRNKSNKLKSLLDSGFNVNVRFQYDDTALHIACNHGHLDIVRVLLEHPNIDVNAKTSEGTTALLLACEQYCSSVDHSLAIIDALLAHKDVDVSAGQAHNLTVLQWLVYLDCSDEFVVGAANALMSKTSLTPEDKDTALNAAIQEQKTRLALALIEGGANVNADLQQIAQHRRLPEVAAKIAERLEGRPELALQKTDESHVV